MWFTIQIRAYKCGTKYKSESPGVLHNTIQIKATWLRYTKRSQYYRLLVRLSHDHHWLVFGHHIGRYLYKKKLRIIIGFLKRNKEWRRCIKKELAEIIHIMFKPWKNINELYCSSLSLHTLVKYVIEIFIHWRQALLKDSVTWFHEKYICLTYMAKKLISHNLDRPWTAK